MDAQEKADRLVEVAMVALAAAPAQRLNAVVLNKVLFYSELAALRDWGKPLTGNAYVALQQGPVVAQFQRRLIGELETRGLAEQLEEWTGAKPVHLTKGDEPIVFLNDEERTLIARVACHFARGTSQQASDYSHENPGWQLAWSRYRREGRPAAIDLIVAMQQIVEDDPWMDEPLLSEEDALAVADSELGEDW